MGNISGGAYQQIVGTGMQNHDLAEDTPWTNNLLCVLIGSMPVGVVVCAAQGAMFT